jgi:transcriptional regulator with XRE-family HTH domain
MAPANAPARAARNASPHTARNRNGSAPAPGTGNGDDVGGRRREELADFLKARRAALQPEDVGLPGCGRRRTPGLRREEVAQLAGVGTTWYTWLEQGRDVRASLSVLEGIARALRMTPAERGHLIVLGRGEQAPPPAPARESVSPTVQRLVAHLGPNPANVLGRRYDFLAWNDAFTAVFGDLAQFPPEERNQIWLTFMDPARRELTTDWEVGARRLLARFRADHAQYVGDPAFEALIESLLRASPEFRKWWPRHEVLGSGEGRKTLNHPIAGLMSFEHAIFRHSESPEHRLVLYSPLPENDTQAKLAALLEPAVA